jgi:hypothetical protein
MNQEGVVAEVIRSIFINPPIAIARLGGSSVPQDAYGWVETADPRADGETTIAPMWSLNVLPDGSLDPVLPAELRFRDGDLIRPVCPFLEVWALTGDDGDPAGGGRETPLTTALLAQHGATLSDLKVTVDAHNLKAARRTRNADLGFGTHPTVEIGGDDHGAAALLGVSPPNVRRPMIPKGRNIPLGSVQVLRSQPTRPDAPWKEAVDLEVIRLRFTPGPGRFYGPPQAARATGALPFPAVSNDNAFLDPAAGWFNAAMSDAVVPADTYDGAQRNNDSGPSLGVVDDTCEARIEVALKLPGSRAALTAHANVFVGPPDFAPDRRPFLSLADEINDRAGDAAARTAAMTADQQGAWVEDLFERIYETVSLLNVDHYRAARGVTLSGQRLAAQLVGDEVPNPRQAMGGRDALRNPFYRVAAATPNQPLPLSQHARRQHRAIADLQNLRDFIALMPDRVPSLVRPPFAIEDIESPRVSTMRMPPFMRQSNAQPLTLSSWQYDLLMAWLRSAAAQPAEVAAIAPAAVALPAAAARRRAAVLARLAPRAATDTA